MIIWLCPHIYTYSLFMLRKLTWPKKILEVLSDSPIMPWLHGFTWYTWPCKDIFHMPHLTIIFSGRLPISARVEQESNLNQIDGRVSILWEHLNCIQQQKRTPSGTWMHVKGTLASGMPCVPKVVECLPWERWAINSLIIMINYWVQGIELFQKLYGGLEYVVSKDMGKSSKINEVVREFCKISERVKAASIMSKNCK